VTLEVLKHSYINRGTKRVGGKEGKLKKIKSLHYTEQEEGGFSPPMKQLASILEG